MGKLTLFLHDVHSFDAFFDVKYIWVLHIITSLITSGSLQGYSALKTSKTDKKVTKKWKKWYCHSSEKRSCCGTKQDREFSFDKFLTNEF